MEPPEERPVSALPSARARALAFLAVVGGGICGGIIGSSLASLQCRQGCVTAAGAGAIVGSLLAAAGVAVVAVLVLRAMGEWTRTSDVEVGTGAGPPDDERRTGP